MIEFPRILFPVDLSEASPQLAEYAMSLGARFSAELHVLYVVRTFETYQGVDYVPSVRIDAVQEELTAGMKRSLESFVAKHMAGYPSLMTAITSGHVGREILRYIDEHDVSLVVMGTHGRRGLGRAFFGSVAQRVVQNSPVPVMTINPYRE